jgi:hypothetical protein
MRRMMRMGVRVTDPKNVAIFDSVTGLAFGPIFESESDVYDFLEWIESGASAGWTFKRGDIDVKMEPDARHYTGSELDELKMIWSNERENAEGN